MLKRQILYNQRKENRKLAYLSNLVSVKFEEKENVTRKYLQQLELEALYLKEINSLKKELTSFEAKYKMLQNNLTESSSITKETGKNKEEFPGLSSIHNEYDNVKSKSHKQDKVVAYYLLYYTLLFLLVCLFSLTACSVSSKIRSR